MIPVFKNIVGSIKCLLAIFVCLLLAMPAWAYNYSGYLTGTTTNMQFRLTNEGFHVGSFFTRNYLEPPVTQRSFGPYYGSEEINGKYEHVRYHVHSGGGITSEYGVWNPEKEDYDWHSYSTKLSHAFDTNFNNFGVWARKESKNGAPLEYYLFDYVLPLAYRGEVIGFLKIPNKDQIDISSGYRQFYDVSLSLSDYDGQGSYYGNYFFKMEKVASVTNATFSNNAAGVCLKGDQTLSVNGLKYNGNAGGLDLSADNKITLNNSRFSGNFGSSTITSDTIVANGLEYSGNSGPLYLDGKTEVDLNNSVFSGNTAGISRISALYIEINNLKYTGNTATLSLEPKTYVTMDGSEFSKNKCLALKSDKDKDFNIFNTKFIENDAPLFYFEKGDLVLVDSVISDNAVKPIYINHNTGKINSLAITSTLEKMENVQVLRNTTKNDTSVYTTEGGLYVKNGTRIAKSSFIDNQAIAISKDKNWSVHSRGGAFYGNVKELVDSVFKDNMAISNGAAGATAQGGAVYTHELTGKNLEFTGNGVHAETEVEDCKYTVQAFGGALVSSNRTDDSGGLVLDNVRFTSNTSEGYRVNSAYEFSYLSASTALSGYAGALAINGGNADLNNLTFEKNSAHATLKLREENPLSLIDMLELADAKSQGGGLYGFIGNDRSFSLRNSTFSDNTADASVTVHISSPITAINARSYGGGLYITYSRSTDKPMLDNVRFTGNLAKASATQEVNFSDSINSIGTSAVAAGGGAYLYESSGRASNLSFTNNKAEAYASCGYSPGFALASVSGGGLAQHGGGRITLSGQVVFQNNIASATLKGVGVLSNNQAIATGGAIDLGGDLRLDGSSSGIHLTNNLAIASITTTSSGKLQMVRADAYGGAAHIHGGDLTIINGLVSNNSARAEAVSVGTATATKEFAAGGAFYVGGSGNLELTDTDVVNNKAIGDISQGGAIYVSGASDTYVNARSTDVFFSGNQAKEGADVYLTNGAELYLNAAEGRKISMTGGIAGETGTVFQQGKGSIIMPLTGLDSTNLTFVLGEGTLRTTNPIRNASLSGINLGGGTLDMRDGGITILMASELEDHGGKPTKLYVDYDASSGLMDKIQAGMISTSLNTPKLYLTGVNIMQDGTAKQAQYLSGFGVEEVEVRTDSLYVQSSGGYLYTFTPVAYANGQLSVSRTRSDGSLFMALGNDDIDAYSLTSDSMAEVDLGTMAGSGRTFTIFGNGHTLTGGKIHTGVTITSGQTLNINALSLQGFKNCAILNDGKVHLSDVSLANNTMDIVNNGELYLEGGAIRMHKGIRTSKDGAKDGKVFVEGARVTMDSGSVFKQSSLTLRSGELTLNKGSELELETLAVSSGSVTLSGSSKVAKAELNSSSLALINSGLHLDSLVLNGATLYLDPAYLGVYALTSNLNGQVYVGDGSVLNIGAIDGLGTIASNAGMHVKKTNPGFTVGSGESILALGQTVALSGDSRLIVDAKVASDGSGTDAPIGFAAYFGKGSLTVMTAQAAEAGGLNGGGSGSLAVADGAKIALINAKSGRTYSLASGFTMTTHSDSGWLGKNVLLANYALNGTGQFTSDGYTVTTTRRSIRQTFPDIIAASSINTMVARGQNDVYSPEPGIRFLSRAIQGGLFLAKRDVKNTVNEVSRASVTANVQHTAFRAIEASEDAIEQQLSSAGMNAKSVSVRENGWHVWAIPLHTNTYTHDMGASGHSVNGHFTGLVLGIGKIFGDFTLGVSVNGGGGYSETRGTITETKDSHNFGGANLYAAWNSGAWNVSSSVGFALSNHDVSMDLPGSLGIGSQKAQIHTQAWNANLRAEYALKTETLDIIPHAGVRFVSLRTLDHDLDDLASYESDPQNIVQFPVGVTFSKDFVAGSWNLSPALDLTFVPTVGNRRAETRVRFTGIDAEDSVRTRVLDDCAFKGSLGLTASKGGFSVGLAYTLKASSHETDHGIQANLMWEF